MIYLQTILQRPEGELIRRVYEEMKADPIKNDWSQLVSSDFQEVNLSMNDDQIRQMSQTDYKNLVKQKVREAAYIEFKEQQAGHEKGRLLEHQDLLKPQGYLLTNLLTNKQTSLLYNLRCQSVKGIRNNFHRQYQNIRCQLCMLEIDSQNHVLYCPVIQNQFNGASILPYEYIHGNLEQQVSITILYSSLLEVRDRLLDEGQGPGVDLDLGAGLPGRL